MDFESGSVVLLKARSISNQLLRTLNSLIIDEFNAIHHYLTHSSVCGGWGYKALEAKFQEEVQEELVHAKLLMDRITVFDKVPTLNRFPDVERSKSVKDMIEKQVELEKVALKDYNAAVKMARKEGDHGTKGVLMQILLDEEKHYDWLKAQLDKIEQMGIQNYLLTQTTAPEEDDNDDDDDTEKAMGTSSAKPLAVEFLDDKMKMTLTENSPRSAGGKALSGGDTIMPLDKASITMKPPSSKKPKVPIKSGPTYPAGIRPGLKPRGTIGSSRVGVPRKR